MIDTNMIEYQGMIAGQLKHRGYYATLNQTELELIEHYFKVGVPLEAVVSEIIFQRTAELK